MAKINSYPIVNPTNDDLILGTDATRADQPTKNFKVSSLIALVTGGATGLGTVISLNQSAKSPFTPFNNQSAIDFLNITGTGTVTFNSLTDGTFNTTGGATTTSTLTTAGTATGVTQASGLSRKKTGNTTEYTLFAAASHSDDKAHKVYLKNISTTAAEYFEIQVAGVVIGRLYAGDWTLFPWAADTTGTNCDIDITPSASNMTLEHMLFIDE